MGSGEKPLILIADDSEVSREYLAHILMTAGYDVIKAIDGGSAFKVVNERKVDLAIIDHFMAPYGGLDFAKGIRLNNLDLPMVMITNEETSDLLFEVSKYNISMLLHKPVDPSRLLEVVRRSLRHGGKEEEELKPSQLYKMQFSQQELMDRVIDKARQNLADGHGGPFAAIVADADGNILGEGVNGIGSRSDPVAHAEVMAIRQATEKLNRTSLDGCILYSSSEPTRVGKALIDSVGIGKVYFGLTYVELNNYLPRNRYENAEYIQLHQSEALEMLNSIKAKD